MGAFNPYGFRRQPTLVNPRPFVQRDEIEGAAIPIHTINIKKSKKVSNNQDFQIFGK